METRQDANNSVAGEQTKRMQDNGTQDGGVNCTIDVTTSNLCVIKPNEVVKNSHSTLNIYRQDVVKCNSSGMIGIVTAVAGDSDSDSDSSDTDESDEDEEDDAVDDNEDGDEDDDEEEEADEEEEEEEDDEDSEVASENKEDSNVNENDHQDKSDDNDKNVPLSPGQVQVLWLDDTEKTHNINDVTVIDRVFLHGYYLASASDPTGQVGVVVNVNISVDLQTYDGSIIKDVSSKEIKRIRDFASGDYVVLGPWLGKIDDVIDNVTVLFKDGSVCRVLKADPLNLRPVCKNAFEDGNFPYYPGQTVKASSSSVFKNSRWLAGSWKANRSEGTVIKVTVGSVFIYWIASAGYGPDSSTAPAEEQSPKHLKHLSCFSDANWQLGDWCLLPSGASVSYSTSLDQGLSKLDIHDSDQSESDSTKLSHNGGEPSELSVSKESVVNDKSEARPLNRKKFRKVIVRREKKDRRKEENFERAVKIVNTRTTVDVAWQDGTTERGLLSTTLIPIDNPGDHEFVAEQYVVEKASADSEEANEVKRVGVIKSVNAKERTACVRWLKLVSRAEDPREFDEEEIVSVYELEGHPDYDYCYGDVVVRLSPVSVSAQTSFHEEESGMETPPHIGSNAAKKLECDKSDDLSCDETCNRFTDLSWVGNISGLRNGDIEVTWADGMVSTVGPQAIYVVGRDGDDDSVAAGSGINDDAASWETMDDDEADAIDNLLEEPRLDNNSNHELVDSSEIDPGRNGAMSIPLAAFGFVARLASGIFSRGKKHTDSIPSGSSRGEDELQPQSSMNSLEKGAFNDDISDEEHVATEATDLDTTLNHIRSSELENPACGFLRFDITRNPEGHHFLDTIGQKSNERKWLKKVQQDWNILQNNLPDGIYVRAYEDRMDLLRAVIVGAYGTPYQDGLFFFDFHLPPEYPSVPPSAYYHSGGWRINPNLYEEGKVCLSLLNTWTGRGNEVWDPDSSSILQVLVSLQGLVLNSRPYFNEAGYDKQIGTSEGEKNSLSYNENTFLLNCKTMMFLMRRAPKDFEELVKDHFKRRGYYILKACDAYMNGNLIGSLAEDASTTDNNNNANSTSVGFKLMLAKITPKIFMALHEVGAECDEFKHLQNS